MGITKQLLMEQADRDAVADDIQMLEEYHPELDDGVGYWQEQYVSGFFDCVECEDKVAPKTRAYVHTSAGVACHPDCIDNRRGFEHALWKDD